MGEVDRTELALRLADVAGVLAAVQTDDDGYMITDSAHVLSALDYAIRGSSGCVDPDEWAHRRATALVEHHAYLGLYA